MADKKERWNDETPAVLIFTRLLLPLSQTFIKHHAESMFRFRPIMLAWHQSDELRMDGVTQHIVSQTALSKILLYYFGYSRQIAAIVRRYNIQIVHCHFADQAVLMARFAKRQHLPLVVTLHGSDILRRRAPSAMGKFKERLTRHMVDSAALFLPVSAWLHEQAIRLGYPRDRMRLHYLGIPLQQVGDDRRATAVTPTILHVGRLVEKKGLLYLLEAIRILKARGVACKVRVVGSGPLHERAENFIREHNLPVELLGAQPLERVRDEMRAAAIFCMPSTQGDDGDNEGLGIVYLEAQSLGCPVVAFNQGPVGEAVQDGVTGILAEDGNAEDLARKLASLLEDPLLRGRLGSAGMAFVQTTFDIDKQTAKLESLYSDVIAKR